MAIHTALICVTYDDEQSSANIDFASHACDCGSARVSEVQLPSSKITSGMSLLLIEWLLSVTSGDDGRTCSSSHEDSRGSTTTIFS